MCIGKTFVRCCSDVPKRDLGRLPSKSSALSVRNILMAHVLLSQQLPTQVLAEFGSQHLRIRIYYIKFWNSGFYWKIGSSGITSHHSKEQHTDSMGERRGVLGSSKDFGEPQSALQGIRRILS